MLHNNLLFRVIFDGITVLSKKLYMKPAIKGVSLLVFPECCLAGYPPLSIPNTDSVDFELVDNLLVKLQTISNETGIGLVIGTICSEGNSIFNRAVIFRPGTPMTSYDKQPYGVGIKRTLKKVISTAFSKSMVLL